MTQISLAPFEGHLTLKLPCSNSSHVWIKSQRQCHRIWWGKTRCSTEMSASGAKSRWFVVTSIWEFKYLMDQLSGHLRANFLCTAIPFSRPQEASQPSNPFWTKSVDSCLLKTHPAIKPTMAHKLKFSERATGSIVFSRFDGAAWGADYLPSVLTL